MPATAAVIEAPRRVDVPGTLEGVSLKTMGGRIAWSRLRKKMTQADVAQRVGKSRATVVQYEKDNIVPPIPEVERLAIVMGVSPEFLAFGRHGVDAMLNAAEEVITIPEVAEGSKGLFSTGAFAVPSKVFEGKDIEPSKARMFVVSRDETEFGYHVGDRLILDTSVKTVETDHDLYLVQTPEGAVVVRREPNFVGGTKGHVVLTTGRGVSQTVKLKDLDVLGAVMGKFSLVS